MSNTNRPTRTAPGSGDADAVRADIDSTRAELADTVDQLAEKINVKAQASRKANAARGQVSESAARAKASTPPAVQKALDTAGAKVAPLARQVSDRAAPHRRKIIAAMLAATALTVLLRRRHERGQS